jgi:ATP-dependent protease ClpP protease subunit
MAAVLLQAADERVIGPESYLVIHEAASMAWGKASEVKEESDLLIRFNRHTENVLARRSKLTPKEIRQRSYKKDWYVNAKECKKHGFVDRIG